MNKKPKQDVFLKDFCDIINDLGVDGRTKKGITLARLKRGLKKGGNQTFIEIFTNIISLNLLLERELTQELLKQGKLVDPKGNLNPAVSKDLMKLRENTLKYLKMLQSVQGKGGKNNEGFNLAELLNDDNGR